MSELDELLGKKETVILEKPLDTTVETPKDEEVAKKEEHLKNLQKAIAEGTETLREIRKAKKSEAPQMEEELPKIDMEDPGAKAWEKHIEGKVRPMKDESDQEKAEIFNYTFKEFVSDKPILINNPERRKKFLEKYEKIKSSTGRTKEGVMEDLEAAFGAEFHSELVQQSTDRKVRAAQADALFSDIAVSRSDTTSYKNEKGPTIQLSDDDKSVLQKWGMSPEEFIELKKKY